MINKVNAMKLETERLIIRSIEKGDEIVFADMAKDGSLKQDIGFDENFKDWMKDWIDDAFRFDKDDNPKNDFIAYTICLKESKAVVGSVGCSYYEDFDEIGLVLFIGKTYRGKGYAYEATKVYIDYFFEHYDIHKLVSHVREDNISSWKVHEKLGFYLREKKMWQDIGDEKEELYRFYELTVKNNKEHKDGN